MNELISSVPVSNVCVSTDNQSYSGTEIRSHVRNKKSDRSPVTKEQVNKHQTTAYKSDSSVQNKRETQSHKFTQPFVVRSETKSHHKTKKPVQRQIVSGARRIWGTLRSVTRNTIKNTIVHLTKIEAKVLHVKRKFKTSSTGQHRWWLCCMEKKIL